MIRIVIENMLLFLLPTLIYVAYIFLKRRMDGDKNKNLLDDAPLIWLCAAGAALVIITLIFFADTSGGKPGQAYQPPVFRDGKIQPGQIK